MTKCLLSDLTIPFQPCASCEALLEMEKKIPLLVIKLRENGLKNIFSGEN